MLFVKMRYGLLTLTMTARPCLSTQHPESYERKECADMIDALRQRVQELEAAMYINPQKVDTSEPTCIDIGGHPV